VNNESFFTLLRLDFKFIIRANYVQYVYFVLIKDGDTT